MESHGMQSPLLTPGETANQQKTRTHAECSTRGSNPVLQAKGPSGRAGLRSKATKEGEVPSLNQDSVRLSLGAWNA